MTEVASPRLSAGLSTGQVNTDFSVWRRCDSVTHPSDGSSSSPTSAWPSASHQFMFDREGSGLPGSARLKVCHLPARSMSLAGGWCCWWWWVVPTVTSATWGRLAPDPRTESRQVSAVRQARDNKSTTPGGDKLVLVHLVCVGWAARRGLPTHPPTHLPNQTE